MKYLSFKETVLVIALITLGLWFSNMACFGAERPAPSDLFERFRLPPVGMEKAFCPSCGKPLGDHCYGLKPDIQMGDSLRVICQKQSVVLPFGKGGKCWCETCVQKLIALAVPEVTARLTEQKSPVDPELYADPIPQSITNRLLEGHGFTAEQCTAFSVVRILPLELGGTNAVSNLQVISSRDAQWRQRADALVLLRVKQNQLSVDAAIKALSTVESNPVR